MPVSLCDVAAIVAWRYPAEGARLLTVSNDLRTHAELASYARRTRARKSGETRLSFVMRKTRTPVKRLRALMAAPLRLGIDERNRNGATALIACANAGSARAVRALLRAGADWRLATTRGETAMARAAYRGRAKVITELVAGGADVHYGGVRDGGSSRPPPLLTALYGSNPRGDAAALYLRRDAAALELVRLGADVNVVHTFDPNDGFGAVINTPLHLACFQRDVPSGIVIGELVRRGADVNARDGDGYTVIARVVIRAKFSEHMDEEGTMHPTHGAMYEDMMRILLSAPGADVMQANHGETAVELAETLAEDGLAAMMRAHSSYRG